MLALVVRAISRSICGHTALHAWSIGLLCVTCTVGFADEEMRTWTDSTGKHTREGQFVRAEDNQVFLKLKSGKEIAVKYDRLSDEDKAYVNAAKEPKKPRRPSFRELLANQIPKMPAPTGLNAGEQQEAELLGKRLEQALAEGIDPVAQLFDMGYFGEQTLTGLDLPPDGKTALMGQAATNLKQFIQVIVSNPQKGFGPWKFVRGRRVEGTKRLLFRTVNETDAFPGYYEFIYESPADSATPLRDIWLFNAGEKASSTLRRGNIMIAGAINQSYVTKLVLGEADIVKHKADLDRAIELHKQGKVAEAIAQLKSLPDSIRKDKTYLLCRLNWSNQAKMPQEYNEAMHEFESAFPRDSVLAFSRLPVVAASGDKALFMETVDKIDSAVGGDSYLLVFRGLWVGEHVKDSAAARNLFLQAIASDRKATHGVIGLLLADLEAKNYPEVAELLAYCEEECGLNASQLINVFPKECEGFLASAVGKKWSSSRRSSSP